MKPRTKIEREVDRLSNTLLPLTPAELQEATSKIFKSYFYKNKTSGHCLDCGNEIDLVLIGRKKKIKCPHCDSTLEIKKTLDRVLDIKDNYFAKCELIKVDGYDFQLTRNFVTHKYCRKGEKARIITQEVCQNWYCSQTNKRVVFSSIEEWWGFHSGDMEIRRPTFYKKYKPYPSIYLSTSKFREEYKKYGISSKMQGVLLEEIISEVKNNSKVETLLKSKYHWILDYFNFSNIDKHWNSIKILMRHKYKLNPDFRASYLDYLNLLMEDNKDLRNPFYVCPKNFHKAHQQVLNRVHRFRVERQRNQEIRTAEYKARKDEEGKQLFYKLKSKYFDFTASKGNIEIRVLSSIEDYIEESKEMKHCVNTGSYYSKKDTLCLTSTYNGKPAETIEICLNKFFIIQSRGKNNLPTEHHDDIVNLIESSMHEIKRITFNEKQQQTA